MVKIFGEAPAKMTYQELTEHIKQIFDAAAAGERTWDNYFGERNAEPGKTLGKADHSGEDTVMVLGQNMEISEQAQPSVGQDDQIPGQHNIQTHP